jgi:hypothetical protein
MLFLLAIALGVGIAAYALWRVPTWIGVLHAAAGLVVYAVIGYMWILALFFSPKIVEPIIAPLRRVHLDAVFVLLLYFAPPVVAALVTVRLLGRDRMSR